MAEPQPGRPGGGGTGARSATAATFQVNDASLRDLRKTWQGLTDDVKNFSKAVADLKRHERDIERLGEKLGGISVPGSGGPGGGSGGRAPGMPPVPAPPAPPAAAPPAGGGGPGAGGGGGGGGRPANGGTSVFSTRNVALGAGGAFAAAATYTGVRMGGISDNDLLYNQLGRAQGGTYNQGNRQQEQRNATRFGGYQNMEDLNTGVRNVTGALGGTLSSGRTANVFEDATRLSGLNPSLGLAGTTQGVASMYSATSANRLRSAGAASIGVGGAAAPTTQVFDKVLQQVFRRSNGKFTAQNITEGMVPGAPLQRTLDYLLPDPNSQALFRDYALTKASLGGDSSKTNRALNALQRINNGEAAGGDRKLVNDAGLTDNIRTSQNRLAQQQAENATNVGEMVRGGTMQGNFGLAGALGGATSAMQDINDGTFGFGGDAVGAASVLGGPSGTILNAIGGVPGATMLAQQLGISLPGGGGGGTAGGGGPGAGGGGGGSGDPGGPTQRVWVVNQCCGPGGAGGSGSGSGDGDGDGSGGSNGPGLPGRLGLRAAGMAAAGVAAAGSSFFGLDTAQDAAARRWGQRDKNGTRSTGDRIGHALGTVGETAGAGALGGAAIGAFLGPGGAAMGAAIGGVGGTALGAARAGIGWFRGENRKTIRPDRNDEGDKAAVAPPPARFHSIYDTEGGHARMSRGGIVSGHHSRDDVDIKATPGELVVPLPVVSRFGGARKLMQALGFSAPMLGGSDNRGGYAKGGEVDGGWGRPGDSKNMVRISGGGKSLEVHRKAAGSFKGFLDELAAAGYEMKSVGGYNARKIAGTDRWSNHAYGASIDIDPFELGNGFDKGTKSKIGTGFKGNGWITSLARKWGLGWGGEWSGRKDWMHFEAIGAPASSKRYGVGGALQGASGDMTSGAGAAGGSDVHEPSSGSGSTLARGSGVGSYTSEAEALAGILGGSAGMGGGGALRALGAAVKSQTSSGQVSDPNVATTGATPDAPSNISSNAKLGQTKAAARGWTGEEWNSLYQLWQKESGWNHNAANPNSSARGIPQAMMSAHFGKGWKKSAEAKAWMTSPAKQIDWGLDYIAGRYKQPSKAWAHSQKVNWYERGAVDILQDEMAQLHAGEMVVPANQAKKLRAMIQSGRRAGLEQGVAPGGVPEQSRRTVSLSITAPVTVVGKATADDAKRFLQMVKHEAETQATLDMIGAG